MDCTSEEIEEALWNFVEAYRHEEIIRTADCHPNTCSCLRCAFDRAEALLERIGKPNPPLEQPQ